MFIEGTEGKGRKKEKECEKEEMKGKRGCYGRKGGEEILEFQSRRLTCSFGGDGPGVGAEGGLDQRRTGIGDIVIHSVWSSVFPQDGQNSHITVHGSPCDEVVSS